MKYIALSLSYLLIGLALLFAFVTSDAYARGGYSSSGSRGGFSSSSRSYSSSRTYSAPSRSYSSSPARRTITTTTTTRSRSYYGGGGGYHYYGYHPMMYPGFGMGYGYSNGLMEGLIIGNLMHPAGTTVYSGGGYSGTALLYPNGAVVDQNGMQVGNYQNGNFAPVQNGQFVAQQAPANAVQTMQDQSIQAAAYNTRQIVEGVICIILIVLILILFFA